MKSDKELLSLGILPSVLNEKQAAEYIGQSYMERRQGRYDDRDRLARGEKITGPAWFAQGPRRIRYRLIDLQTWVEAINPAERLVKDAEKTTQTAAG
jgi:hypothetical protein